MVEFDPKAKISKYFTWKDALWLPQWNRMANEADGLNSTIVKNLVGLFLQMDIVRDFFAFPIHVIVTYRPDPYNVLVNGSKNSMHKVGMASDFFVYGFTSDQARQNILDQDRLDIWDMRMECMPGASWVHLDQKEVPPGGKRYFIP